MAATILFSGSTQGLTLRPQDVQQALPLADVEYLLALQAQKPYQLLLVNPGIGNVAEVFATDSLCKKIVAVGASPVFRANMTALELDDFVTQQAALPQEGLDSMVVLWDDTVGELPLTQQAVDLLKVAKMFVIRKPLEWSPPVQGVWEPHPATDRRTVLYTYTPKGVTPTAAVTVEALPAPVGAPAPSGGVLVGLITPEEKEAWQRRLVAFLRTFLPKFITAPSLDAYLAPTFMQTWYDAFTHEVVDPNANYETLEFIGDVALENAIAKYLVTRFPKATKGQYNEMKRALVEKQGLKVVSRNLGLSSMLLTFKNTQHIAEDVVESFLGALASVSDQLVAGLGDINVYNYVVWYYNQQDISPEREGQMPPKTIVQQTFEKFFDQKTVRQEDTKVPGGVLVKAVVPQNVVSDMKRIYGKDIPAVLGEGVAPTAKAASAKAYQAARDLLNQLGITFEWAERVQREREFNAPEMQRYYQAAVEKARGEGFTELVLLKSSTLAGKEGTLVGLAGVQPNGKRTTVAIGEGAQRFDAAVAAVKAYSGL
jgi:dsRNA-specific ribonuclease